MTIRLTALIMIAIATSGCTPSTPSAVDGAPEVQMRCPRMASVVTLPNGNRVVSIMTADSIIATVVLPPLPSGTTAEMR